MTANKSMLRWTFIFSILLNILAALYFGRKFYSTHQTYFNNAPAKRVYYLERNKLFDVLPNDSNAIIFLGNSLTQYFELAEFLQNIHIKNRGIHGDMIEGVLARLTPIIETRPKKIFIELGLNDLEQGETKEKLLNNYKKLIDTLNNSCQRAKIYVQSLFPVANNSQRLPSYCSPKMNELIRDVNDSLKNYVVNNNCTYIDVHKQFLEAGQLKSEYAVDGVHLSGEGYLLWAKLLKPYVDE